MMADPINGLRGFASLQVMLGHYGFFLKTPQFFMPAMEMPMFFLLSGYCLTLGYGNGKLDLRSYLQNRFARILPLYYLINLYVAPLKKILSWTLVVSKCTLPIYLIITFLCTNSWFTIYNPSFPKPFSTNNWTINTLWFFYMVYPLILPRLQTLSDAAISRLLVILYYVQLVPFLYYWHYKMSFDAGRAIVAKNPLCRLPVFIMGILGALQTQRWQKNVDFQDPNDKRFILHVIFPWGVFGSPEDKPFDKERSKAAWGIRSDFSFLIFILFCSTKLLPHTVLHKNSSLRRVLPEYGQLLLVHVMLSLLIGLSRGKTKSLIGRLFSTNIFQKIGACSFALYIIHLQFMVYYFKNIVRRKRWLNGLEMTSFCVVAVLLAYLVHKFIENPLGNLLRYKKKKPSTRLPT